MEQGLLLQERFCTIVCRQTRCTRFSHAFDDFHLVKLQLCISNSSLRRTLRNNIMAGKQESFFFIILLFHAICHETHGSKLSRNKRFLPSINWGKVYKNIWGVSTIKNQFANNLNQYIIQVVGYIFGGGFVYFFFNF